MNEKNNKKNTNTDARDVILSEAKDLSNREFFTNLFAEDGIKAPDSLSEEAMLTMLDRSDSSEAEAGAEIGKPASSSEFKPARRKAVRWLALAACALLAAVGIPKIYYSDIFMPDTSAKNGELHEFRSRSEIERIVRSLTDSDRGRFRLFDKGAGELVEYSTGESDMAATEPSMNAAEGGERSAGGSAGQDHSSTYLQVEDVDEADIVKVDGRYIYAVNNKREVLIYEAADGKVKKVATLGNNGIEQYIENIFLKGDVLVAIGRVYDGDESYIAVVSYDIKDRSRPEIINEFRQGGDHVVSSRMVGDYVYLVTNTYAYSNYIIPKCTIDGEYREIPYADISCVPGPTTPSYIILSAVDIASGSAGRAKTKAVFGASEEIYCNNSNLYVTTYEWNGSSDKSGTRIIRAALDGLKIKFNGTTTVKGYINNQFSMDEHNGYFRIATTAERGGINVNNLFVLDEKLNEVGSINGFARDESIKAVRFMGDKAYVITYEAIDPLFIMDLSDPASPRIEGEVKIDGFSSLLVPAGADRLLGIGHATGDNGYGGQYASGLKLALFDTSDPSEPKVLDSKEFENMESPAQSTHLALTVNESSGYYAIPYNIWHYGTGSDVFLLDDAEEMPQPDGFAEDKTYEESIEEPEVPENETGVLVFGLGGDSKDKIEVYDQHKMDAVQILRNVYIADYIYGITGAAEIESFRFTK